MIIVIDESGEISVRSMRRYFILGLIKIENNKSAEKIVEKINDFALKINHKSEFKFSKSSDLVRTQFLNSVKNCDFEFSYIVIDKTKLTGFLSKNPKEAYNYFLKKLLEISSIKPSSLIFIDGGASRQMRSEVNSYLKNLGLEYKRLEFCDSSKNRLIQFVDMFVGAVGTKYNKSNKFYFDMIKKKIESEWIF